MIGGVLLMHFLDVKMCSSKFKEMLASYHSKFLLLVSELNRESVCYYPKRSSWSLFTVKFRIEDGSIVLKLTHSLSV